MKEIVTVLSLMIFSSTVFAVDTVCSNSANTLQIRFQNLDTQARLLPSKVDVIVQKNGNSNVFNNSKVQGLGPIPQGTVPPSGPSSMADGPYLISNFEIDSSGERTFVSVWYLKAESNGQVTLTLNKGAGLFGVKETTINCSLQ